MFLNCFYPRILDFKILILIEERKACYTMVIVIELRLYSGDISWRCLNKKYKGPLRTDTGNGRSMVESRYHNFGLTFGMP